MGNFYPATEIAPPPHFNLFLDSLAIPEYYASDYFPCDSGTFVAHQYLDPVNQAGGVMHHLKLSNPAPGMEQCIQECLDCYSECMNTIMHCLKMGGKHAEAAHIRTMMDCAEICRTAADFMLRSSPLHGKTCAVCAEACDKCAQSCESIGDSDQMSACASVCRKCSESCRKMAG